MIEARSNNCRNFKLRDKATAEITSSFSIMDLSHSGDVTPLHVYTRATYCAAFTGRWKFDRFRGAASY